MREKTYPFRLWPRRESHVALRFFGRALNGEPRKATVSFADLTQIDARANEFSAQIEGLGRQEF